MSDFKFESQVEVDVDVANQRFVVPFRGRKVSIAFPALPENVKWSHDAAIGLARYVFCGFRQGYELAKSVEGSNDD